MFIRRYMFWDVTLLGCYCLTLLGCYMFIRRCTTAIYAGRANLKPVVFERYQIRGVLAGQLMTTTEVENFQGYPEGITDQNLMDMSLRMLDWFGSTSSLAGSHNYQMRDTYLANLRLYLYCMDMFVHMDLSGGSSRMKKKSCTVVVEGRQNNTLLGGCMRDCGGDAQRQGCEDQRLLF